MAFFTNLSCPRGIMLATYWNWKRRANRYWKWILWNGKL